jgi:hypothetical protein
VPRRCAGSGYAREWSWSRPVMYRICANFGHVARVIRLSTRSVPGGGARMVWRCHEVQRRTRCSSKPGNPIPAWMDSSMVQRVRHTRASGADARWVTAVERTPTSANRLEPTPASSRTGRRRELLRTCIVRGHSSVSDCMDSYIPTQSVGRSVSRDIAALVLAVRPLQCPPPPCPPPP